MPAIIGGSFSTPEMVFLGLLGLLAVLVVTIGVRAWLHSRVSPQERERRRRLVLGTNGKISDALLTEIRGELLFFSYDVRGVGYIASQDVSALRDRLPRDFSIAGPVFVKYDAKNPANSIILSEVWSGLRTKD